jgi:yecA family protein
MPVILGREPEKSAVFADSEDATDTISLLMRYWNSTAEDFRSGDHIHVPYAEEPGTDNIPGRDWARGLMRGTRLVPRG